MNSWTKQTDHWRLAMYDLDSLVPMAQKTSVVHTFLRMASYRHPQMKRTMDPKQTYVSTKLYYYYRWNLASAFLTCYTSNKMYANVDMSMSESHTTKDCSMDAEHLYNVHLSSICPLPLMGTWIASGALVSIPIPSCHQLTLTPVVISCSQEHHSYTCTHLLGIHLCNVTNNRVCRTDYLEWWASLSKSIW